LEIDKLYLPNNWISNKKVFLLKVRGESMIGANIKEDDFVLVVKQSSADVRDIVVASLGDKAVLKRYNKIGNNVLLLSENKDYEPILIETEQAKILGKVIGILKVKN
jgi:SOS-response transcriptional repressor LexA